MSQRYFQMDVSGESADIVIYGDITSWPWLESDVSSYGLAKRLAELDRNVSNINVRINSYGGEVAEGIAIFNALRNHGAHVTTVCDGFACSIASVIFMAGDERVMNEASLLMIHNAWSCAAGNAEEHRKEADDLDTVTNLSKQVYLSATDLTEDELTEWMDAETFIDSKTALEHGFATKVEPIDSKRASQSALATIGRMLTRQEAAHVTMQIDEDAMAHLLYNALKQRFEQAVETAEEPIEKEPDADDGRVRMASAYLALN